MLFGLAQFLATPAHMAPLSPAVVTTKNTTPNSLKLFSWNPHYGCYLDEDANGCGAKATAYLTRVLDHFDIDFANVIEMEDQFKGVEGELEKTTVDNVLGNGMADRYGGIEHWTKPEVGQYADYVRLFYNSQKWGLSKDHDLGLGEFPDESGARPFIVAQFSNNADGKKVCVIAAHFPHDLAKVNIGDNFSFPNSWEGLKTMIHDVKVCDEDSPKVMMADTNQNGDVESTELANSFFDSGQSSGSESFASCCNSYDDKKTGEWHGAFGPVEFPDGDGKGYFPQGANTTAEHGVAWGNEYAQWAGSDVDEMHYLWAADRILLSKGTISQGLNPPKMMSSKNFPGLDQDSTFAPGASTNTASLNDLLALTLDSDKGFQVISAEMHWPLAVEVNQLWD